MEKAWKYNNTLYKENTNDSISIEEFMNSDFLKNNLNARINDHGDHTTVHLINKYFRHNFFSSTDIRFNNTWDNGKVAHTKLVKLKDPNDLRVTLTAISYGRKDKYTYRLEFKTRDNKINEFYDLDYKETEKMLNNGLFEFENIIKYD